MTPLTVGELRLALIGLPDEAHIWCEVFAPPRLLAAKVTAAVWDEGMGMFTVTAAMGPT